MAWTDAARKAALEARRRHKRALPADPVSIGDLVKLQRPLQGFQYASIKGFHIDPRKTGLGPQRGFVGAKVLGVSATLKRSPFHSSDYGPDVVLKHAGMRKLDAGRRQFEINQLLRKGRR